MTDSVSIKVFNERMIDLNNKINKLESRIKQHENTNIRGYHFNERMNEIEKWKKAVSNYNIITDVEWRGFFIVEAIERFNLLESFHKSDDTFSMGWHKWVTATLRAVVKYSEFSDEDLDVLERLKKLENRMVCPNLKMGIATLNTPDPYCDLHKYDCPCHDKKDKPKLRMPTPKHAVSTDYLPKENQPTNEEHTPYELKEFGDEYEKELEESLPAELTDEEKPKDSEDCSCVYLPSCYHIKQLEKEIERLNKVNIQVMTDDNKKKEIILRALEDLKKITCPLCEEELDNIMKNLEGKAKKQSDIIDAMLHALPLRCKICGDVLGDEAFKNPKFNLCSYCWNIAIKDLDQEWADRCSKHQNRYSELMNNYTEKLEKIEWLKEHHLGDDWAIKYHKIENERDELKKLIAPETIPFLYDGDNFIAQDYTKLGLVAENGNLKSKIKVILTDMNMSLGQMSNFHSSRIEKWIKLLEEKVDGT